MAQAAAATCSTLCSHWHGLRGPWASAHARLGYGQGMKNTGSPPGSPPPHTHPPKPLISQHNKHLQQRRNQGLGQKIKRKKSHIFSLESDRPDLPLEESRGAELSN